jgi:ferredoxin
MKKQKTELKNKNVLIWVGVFITLSLGVVYKLNKDSTKTTETGEKNKVENKTTLNNEEGNNEQVEFKKLSVLTNKCRGCGKCTRIDPAHFEINLQTGKAMVISSTNLESESLTLAIQSCPDSAISLE